MTMIKMEPRMKGRLPMTFDPAAVTEAVKPVQKTNKPIVHVEAVSTLTEKSREMMGIAGVSMTDMLLPVSVVLESSWNGTRLTK